MKQFIAPMIAVLTTAVAASAAAETIKYPPFSPYSMNREAEIAPYYNNAMLGGNSHDSMLPRNTDDEGTPFAVIVIPVDRGLAVESRQINFFCRYQMFRTGALATEDS